MRTSVILVLCVLCSVAIVAGQTSQPQSQPQPVPVTPNPVPVPNPSYWNFGPVEPGSEQLLSNRELGLNIFHNPVVQSSDYLLRMADEVCLGDTISINNQGIGGEWYSKGGPEDSPPVLWVDDFAAAKAKLIAGDTSIIPQMYAGSICSGRRLDNHWLNNCVFIGQVVCGHSCREYDQNGNKIPLGDIKVLSDGSYTYDCTVSCFLFIHKVSTTTESVEVEYEAYTPLALDLVKDYCTTVVNTVIDLSFPEEQDTNTLTFTSKIAFKAVVDTRGPSLAVKENGYNAGLGILSFSVRNEGDVEAVIDAINILGSQAALVVYAPESLAPGESDDVLVNIQGADSATIDVAYRSRMLGCQKAKEYADSYTFNLANAATPYQSTVDTTDYRLILSKGVLPEENLLDLRQIVR